MADSLLGFEVKVSPLATQRVHRVAAWPTRKRRRGWCVVVVNQPAVFMYTDPATGWQAMLVHPAIMAKMKAATVPPGWPA